MFSDGSVLKSALIRAARTFGQTFLGIYLAGLIGDGADDRTLKALLSLAVIEKAFAAAVVAVLSMLHRFLDTTSIPSLADKPPAAGAGVEPEAPETRF